MWVIFSSKAKRFPLLSGNYVMQIFLSGNAITDISFKIAYLIHFLCTQYYDVTLTALKIDFHRL